MLPARTAVALAGLVAAVAAPPALAATRVTPLTGFITVVGMNDAGAIIGSATAAAAGVAGPAVFRSGTYTPLPLPVLSVPRSPVFFTATPIDINESGVVVGTVQDVYFVAPPVGDSCPQAPSTTGVVWTPQGGGYSAREWGFIDSGYPFSKPVGVTDAGNVIGTLWQRVTGLPTPRGCRVDYFVGEGTSAGPVGAASDGSWYDLYDVASDGRGIFDGGRTYPGMTQLAGPPSRYAEPRINARGTVIWRGPPGGALSRRGAVEALPAGFEPSVIADDDRVGGWRDVQVNSIVPTSPAVTQATRRAEVLVAPGRAVDLNAKIRTAAEPAYRSWVYGDIVAMNARGRYVVRGCNPATFAPDPEDPTVISGGDDAACGLFLYDGSTRVTGQVTEPPPASVRAPGSPPAALRPVVGVRLRVTGPGGLAATATTDASGRYDVAVPVPGRVTVALVGRGGCVGVAPCRGSVAVDALLGAEELNVRVDATGPAVALGVGRTTRVRRGAIAVPVSCRLVSAPCRTTLIVRQASGARTLARRVVTVPAGARRTASLPVGAVRGRVRITAQARAGARATTTTVTTTLR